MGVLKIDEQIPVPAIMRRIGNEPQHFVKVNAMHVNGDKLYMFANTSLNVFDISDPAAPKLLTRELDMPECSFILRRSDGFMAWPGDVHVATGATQATRVTHWPVTAKDLASAEAGFAKAGWWPSNWRVVLPMGENLMAFSTTHAHVFDLSNLSKPELISTSEFPSHGWGAAAIRLGNRVVGCTAALDITDLYAPRVLPPLRLGRGNRQVYELAESALRAYDGEFALVQEWPLKQAIVGERSFTVIGTHLYVLYPGSLAVFDLDATPAKPGATVELDREFMGLQQRGMSIFLTGANDDHVEYSIRDPKNPQRVKTSRQPPHNSPTSETCTVVQGLARMQSRQPIHGHLVVLRPTRIELLAPNPQPNPQPAAPAEKPDFASLAKEMRIDYQGRGDKIWGVSSLKTEDFIARIDQFAALPLRRLAFQYNSVVSDEAFALLPRLSKLEHLDIYRFDAKPESFAHLAELKSLQHLNFIQDGPAPEALKQLKKLQGLMTLNPGQIDVASVPTLVGAVGIGSLRINGGTAEAMKAVTLLPDLTGLSISGTWDSEGLVHVAGLPLRTINLRGEFDEEGLRHLAEFKELTALRLAWTAVSDRAALHIGRCSKLETLDISRTQIGDAGCAEIAKLERLRLLMATETPISDVGLAQLSKLPRLQNLGVSVCAGVTDEGVKLFDHLQTQIRADHTGVSQELAERLKNRRPNAQPDVVVAESAKPAQRPDTLSCHIEQNVLVLRDAETSAEFARSPLPDDLRDDRNLQHIAFRDDDCWIGSDRGLLHVDLASMTWSRLAIERKLLDVPGDALALAGHSLAVVHSGGEQASFDLTNRRWVAPVQEPTADAERMQSPPILPMVIFLVLLSAAYFGVRHIFIGGKDT